MKLDDLTRLPPEHPPSPYNFPVIANRNGEVFVAALPDGVEVFLVGWLGDSIPTRGRVGDRFVERLFQASEQGKRISDGTMGWHDCELCSTPEQHHPDGKTGPVVRWQNRAVRLYGLGHHLVRLENKAYIAPVLLLHYVLDHGYCPPREFIDAVERGVFLGVDDLEVLSETPDAWMKRHYPHLHETPVPHRPWWRRLLDLL